MFIQVTLKTDNRKAWLNTDTIIFIHETNDSGTQLGLYNDWACMIEEHHLEILRMVESGKER